MKKYLKYYKGNKVEHKALISVVRKLNKGDISDSHVLAEGGLKHNKSGRIYDWTLSKVSETDYRLTVFNSFYAGDSGHFWFDSDGKLKDKKINAVALLDMEKHMPMVVGHVQSLLAA